MIIATTPRLSIRRFTESDVEALVPILGDQEVMQYSSAGPITPEQIKTWLYDRFEQYDRITFSVWAVILSEENKLIGICGVKPIEIDGKIEIEILYRFAKPYWNQGYAFEAVNACKEYAFNTLAINSIIAIIDPSNERSLNIINKLNMAYEKDSVYNKIPVRIYRLSKF